MDTLLWCVTTCHSQTHRLLIIHIRVTRDIKALGSDVVSRASSGSWFVYKCSYLNVDS